MNDYSLLATGYSFLIVSFVHQLHESPPSGQHSLYLFFFLCEQSQQSSQLDEIFFFTIDIFMLISSKVMPVFSNNID